MTRRIKNKQQNETRLNLAPKWPKIHFIFSRDLFPADMEITANFGGFLEGPIPGRN
jgi:hypothetical protein